MCPEGEVQNLNCRTAREVPLKAFLLFISGEHLDVCLLILLLHFCTATGKHFRNMLQHKYTVILLILVWLHIRMPANNY